MRNAQQDVRRERGRLGSIHPRSSVCISNQDTHSLREEPLRGHVWTDPEVNQRCIVRTRRVLKKRKEGTIRQQIQQRARRPQVKKRSIFAQGQQVLWKVALRRNKMEPALYGPYTVTSCGPNNTYIIANDDGVAERILISGDRLRPYKQRA